LRLFARFCGFSIFQVGAAKDVASWAEKVHHEVGEVMEEEI
jgi:hypothetical protein